MKRIIACTVLVLSMSVTPVFAGQRGGGYGDGGGHVFNGGGNGYGGQGGRGGTAYGGEGGRGGNGTGYGGSGYGGNGTGTGIGTGTGYGGSVFFNQTLGSGGRGKADFLFGAASIIGAFNPPAPGGGVYVRGGDVTVNVNLHGGEKRARRNSRQANVDDVYAAMCEDQGFVYDPESRPKCRRPIHRSMK